MGISLTFNFSLWLVSFPCCNLWPSPLVLQLCISNKRWGLSTLRCFLRLHPNPGGESPAADLKRSTGSICPLVGLHLYPSQIWSMVIYGQQSRSFSRPKHFIGWGVCLSAKRPCLSYPWTELCIWWSSLAQVCTWSQSLRRPGSLTPKPQLLGFCFSWTVSVSIRVGVPATPPTELTSAAKRWIIKCLALLDALLLT